MARHLQFAFIDGLVSESVVGHFELHLEFVEAVLDLLATEHRVEVDAVDGPVDLGQLQSSAGDDALTHKPVDEGKL